MNEVIIDVREADEFELQHIKDSINAPLSNFTLVAPGILNQLQTSRIILMCRSGARATQAAEQAKGLGFNEKHQFEVYKGGINQWAREGKPTRKAGRAPLPLIRQVQIVMGILFMIFATLGTFVNPWYSVAAIFLGAGMLFAGVTGDCALASLIAKAPWNRADPNLKKVYCQASGNCD